MNDSSRYYAGSIDSHAHIASLEIRGLDPDTVLDAASRARLGRIVDVGIEPDDLVERLHRFGAHPLLAFTSGLHPTSVRPDDHDRQVGVLERALDEDARSAARPGRRIVAVGEVGLDFYHSQENRELQIEVLERQIGLAARFDLPLIFHNRSSEEELIAMIARVRPKGVMHCFSQDADYCSRCLDLGMYISFGGNLTFRNADEVRRAATLVPDDLLLVETDSPYLSPQAVRGTANHPGHLGFVIDELARLRGSSPERVAQITATNAATLFGISPAREVAG